MNFSKTNVSKNKIEGDSHYNLPLDLLSQNKSHNQIRKKSSRDGY